METILAIIAIIIFCVAAYYLKELLDGIERKQAIAKENKRKQRVLEEARKDKNVFKYNSFKAIEAINSAGGLDRIEQLSKDKWKQSIERIKQLSTSNLKLFSGEIERQFIFANECLERATLLMEDEVSQFYKYQNIVYDERVLKYEKIINNFKQTMPISIEEIARQNNWFFESEYKIIEYLNPENIENNIKANLSALTKGLVNMPKEFVFSKQGRKLNKQDMSIAVIGMTVAFAAHGIGRLNQRQKLFEYGSKTSEHCRNIESVIKSFGSKQETINNLRQNIEEAIEKMQKSYENIKNIKNEDKPFNQYSKEEIRYIGAFYCSGEMLKSALKDSRKIKQI